MKLLLLPLLLAAGARAACPSSCSVISNHAVFLPNGTSDVFYEDMAEVCTGSTIELASNATFSFPVNFAADSIFSDSVIQFTAASNSTTNSTIRIKIENEGLDSCHHRCYRIWQASGC